MGSLLRRYKRENGRQKEKDKKNPYIQKIMNRYFTKLKEYNDLGYDKVKEMVDTGSKEKLKLSSTDKQALVDAYKMLFKQIAEEKLEQIKAQKEENDSIKNTSRESQSDENLQGSTQNISDSTTSSE